MSLTGLTGDRPPVGHMVPERRAGAAADPGARAISPATPHRCLTHLKLTSCMPGGPSGPAGRRIETRAAASILVGLSRPALTVTSRLALP